MVLEDVEMILKSVVKELVRKVFSGAYRKFVQEVDEFGKNNFQFI